MTAGVNREETLGVETLRFQYHLIPIPDVEAGSLPTDNPVTHALAPLPAGGPDDPEAMLLQSLTGIARAVEDQERRTLLVNFLHSYLPFTPSQADELGERLAREGPREAREMLTIWEQIGREKGLVEGRVEGVRQALQLMLEGRFGALPHRWRPL